MIAISLHPPLPLTRPPLHHPTPPLVKPLPSLTSPPPTHTHTHTHRTRTVNHGIMHGTDWLPTFVAGIAGLDVSSAATGRPCPTCDRPVAPLDGVNQWDFLSTGAPSARTEVLLDLQATQCIGHGGASGPGSGCLVPGSGAIRVGKWKLLNGHTGVWGAAGSGDCVARQEPKHGKAPKSFPIPIPLNETNPWCP